jgi:hypothetical protein
VSRAIAAAHVFEDVVSSTANIDKYVLPKAISQLHRGCDARASQREAKLLYFS